MKCNLCRDTAIIDSLDCAGNHHTCECPNCSQPKLKLFSCGDCDPCLGGRPDQCPFATFVGECPEGTGWECQCARCGSSLEWEPCGACGGEGITAPGALYEEDPLWYDMDDYEACHQCGGEASFPICLSSHEWCLLNPLPGRIEIEGGTPEWFKIPSK